MRKICKYDKNNWLMQDKDKNLLLLNEQTNQIFDLQSFIQPERSKREDLINSDEYKNASEIQKCEFRIGLGLKKSLSLD